MAIRTLALATSLALAGTAGALTLREQVEVRGDFVLIGNMLGYDCGAAAAPVVGTVGACGTNTADAGVDVFWRSDSPSAGGAETSTAIGSGSTRSTAVLSLPAGTTVARAWLVWNVLGQTDSTAIFERPGVASTIATPNAAGMQYTNNGPLGFMSTTVVDVTEFVATHGSGAYRISDIFSASVADANQPTGGFGWWLVVIYERDGDPIRQISVFDGLDTLNGGSLTTSITGFRIPAVGASGTLAVVGIGGTAGELDALSWNSLPISAGINGTTDVFNSTRSTNGVATTVTGDLPQMTGAAATMSGLDFDTFDLTSLLVGGNTTAVVDVSSATDSFLMAGLVTSVETAIVDLSASVKVAVDVNGGFVEPGDVIEYTITAHSEADAATGVSVVDTLPFGVTFVPGSLQVLLGASWTTQTDDTPLDDLAEYVDLGRQVVARLGTGATGSDGGSIASGGSASFRFRVTIDAETFGVVENQATLTAFLEGVQTPFVFQTDGDTAAEGSQPTFVTVDSDGDLLSDEEELTWGTDPNDADTDEDGVPDGDEPNWNEDSDGRDFLVNARDPDSDDDGLPDGLELGLDCSHPATVVAVGNCTPDADAGATTTDPLSSDTDEGGMRDGGEDFNRNGQIDPGEGDPTAGAGADDLLPPDTDGDGLSDPFEASLGLDPNDADSDDDGLFDDDEPNPTFDSDNDGLINPLDPDSDDDGLSDGTEAGRQCTSPAIDLSKGWCRPDGDGGDDTTSPLIWDTDGGGFGDGVEDVNLNGRVDEGETNPVLDFNFDDEEVEDGDQDGLGDLLEDFIGSDPSDDDSDDDGTLDGREPNPTLDMDGDDSVDLLDPDSDGDLLFDGTEMGFACDNPDTDTELAQCIPDADAGATRTSAVIPDTDRGGVPDGDEDENKNGQLDAGELDPNFAPDDVCFDPPDEQCNFSDDDCDGETDEGFGVGDPCTVGTGVCAGVGEIACAFDGGTECLGEPGGLESEELCDALDNDCDGETDEPFAVGEVCFRGTGACEAEGVTVCDGPNASTCDAVPGTPTSELCNFLDDDCDELTDEDFPIEESCTAGLGACGEPGFFECSDAATLECFPFDEDPNEGTTESCNGVDDDCDGDTDDETGFGEPCTVGVGECQRTGTNICTEAGGVTCGEVAAEPSPELCDTLDNNCDSATDEGFGLGDVCTVGVGACEEDGVMVCDGNGGAECDAEPGTPGTETCNEIDDDCNQVPDDVAGAGGPCTVGLGVCATEGTLGCDGPGPLACLGTPLPEGVEACNLLDDDCDGETDEGFSVGEACTVGQGACARTGETACTVLGEAECDEVAGEPGEETCNGIDDDCDGETDEGFGVGDACSAGEGACAATGEIECALNGEPACNAVPGEPGAETCDGTDDDCDGETDEGLGVGDACSVGQGECAASGVLACSGGAAVCNATAGEPAAEVCNLLDDDCDGETDEADANGVSPCDLDDDGVSNDADNCPEVANPGQEDVDLDGQGDACSPGIHVRGTTFCATSPLGTGAPATGVWVILAALVIAWRVRRGVTAVTKTSPVRPGSGSVGPPGRRVRGPLVALVAAAGGLAAQDASAQYIRYHQPWGSDLNLVSIGTPDTLPKWQMHAGLMVDYANRPLVLFREADDSEIPFVEHQILLDVTAGIGFPAGFELNIGFPMALFQSGDGDKTSVGAVESFALGDLRIIPKWGHRWDMGFGLGVAVLIQVPTGDQASFMGDDSVVVEPRIMLGQDIGEYVRLALDLGYLIRPEAVETITLRAGHELHIGLGAEIRAIPGTFSVILEAISKIAADSATDLTSDTAPFEIGGAVRWWPADEHTITAGVGFGVNHGYGTPQVHTYLGYAYTGKEPKDDDRDGIMNPFDDCPTQPEDYDDFQDADGCPDPDNDQDKILDVSDKCPNDPEDYDGFQDEDGCPDPDNDQDKILDVSDKCPNDPEDYDGFDDQDGCPDPDNDQDKILDVSDKCPNDPENYNDFQDEDGCPDQRVVITPEEIKLDPVHFDTDKATLRPDAFPILDLLVETLNKNPDIRKIEIQGHTDERNTDAYNMNLSRRRATTVHKYLLSKGISAERLTWNGYGESQPVIDEHNEAAWAVNRRVVFKILQRDAPKQPE